MKRKTQMSGQLELPGMSPSGSPSSAKANEQDPAPSSLMERIVSRPNMQRAWKRVKQNRGSPGVDGVRIADGRDWLKEHWPPIREELLNGQYRPQPVRHASIPKRDGGERHLGIPTLVDRLIQQAVLQFLQPDWDPTFSEHSHGFRPGRSAWGAITEAKRLMNGGKTWVVDVDLEKFFDRVNHDLLMGRVARRVDDRRVLGLIRRFLEAGILADGVAIERHEGTPQGGPLSPLLANLLLDEVDKELERRGHGFVRYADDLRVFVASKRAGERVMDSLIRLFGKLRLHINPDKSAVDRVHRRPFLGVEFFKRHSVYRTRVSKRALREFKARIRELTRRRVGRQMGRVVADLRSYLLGWLGYFGRVDAQTPFLALESWIRRRLRAIQLYQWRKSKRLVAELYRRGLERDEVRALCIRRRFVWRLSKSRLMSLACPNAYFHKLGLPSLSG